MCTVSWLQHQGRSSGGYDLFCNRDENTSRPPATAPRIHWRRGVRCISPSDPAGGGTWIAVNEFGVGVCLLNAYPIARGAISRGLLVRNLMHYPTSSRVIAAAYSTDLQQFSAFTLLAIEADRPAQLLSWNGMRRIIVPGACFGNLLTSSSVDQEAAALHRRAAFPNQPDVASLLAFHRSHSPRRGPYSVCMHRDDAETVSFSHIRVTGSRVQFDYAAGSPCRSAAAKTTVLRRTHAHSPGSFYAAG